jgi:hypothetical protein
MELCSASKLQYLNTIFDVIYLLVKVLVLLFHIIIEHAVKVLFPNEVSVCVRDNPSYVNTILNVLAHLLLGFINKRSGRRPIFGRRSSMMPMCRGAWDCFAILFGIHSLLMKSKSRVFAVTGMGKRHGEGAAAGTPSPPKSGVNASPS